MMGFLIAIHIIVCTLLIILILIQRGRGGGLAESFHDVESMLGTKTNAFLTRTTTVLSVLFFITCLSLAVLSIRQSRSLLRNVQAPVQEAVPLTPKAEPLKTVTPEQTPKAEEAPKTVPAKTQ